MSNRIVEFFTITINQPETDWRDVVTTQNCSYLAKKCVKTRKSAPEISIGTCTVEYGAKESQKVIICPHRLLERNQVFIDCIHLLTLHEPGNELHKISEVSVPGGSVDYVLASVRNGKVIDFVGIELQALDTTGTLWNERQSFLNSVGVENIEETAKAKPYGMNWKMTAKTILVRLHHKAETFELISKHLVLVLQDCLFGYMQREFQFNHVTNARLGDSIQFHVYSLKNLPNQLRLGLTKRKSTDAKGIATSLGLQASPKVELEEIISVLQAKISDKTLITL